MWWKILLLVIAILLLLFFVAFPNFMFYYMFSRPKRSDKIPKFYLNSPHYKVSRKGMKYMETLDHQDVFMTNRDGLKLHAHYYKAEKETNKFILGIHGYKSYARPEFGPYIEFYHNLGYNVLLPDDRAHGLSEGKYIGFGVLDRFDCIDWAKYIVDTYGENVEIRLHGVSMGAATVISATGERELPKQVKSTIADCGYSSAWKVLSYQVKHMAHLPVFLLSLCEKLCIKRANFDFHNNTPVELVKNAKIPMLFVQGGKDFMVPSKMVYDLYDSCGSQYKKLLFVEEAGHAESIAFEPQKYHQEIMELFSAQTTQNN